tara:strand:- start:911 stop:1408 length:498 start_codon:yes stop_codon:yes gene_type:complete
LNPSLIIFSIIFFDQFSKYLIKTLFLQYQQIDILGSFLRFTYVENKGIAFGIDTSNYHLLITLITIFGISILIYYYNYNLKDPVVEKIPLCFIIGGAIGNAIDRVFVLIPSMGYGGVVDFIDIGINSYRWYIFNVADTAITIGIILYFILEYKYNQKLNDSSGNI